MFSIQGEPDIPSYIDSDLLTAFAASEGVNDLEEAIDRYEEAYQGTFASLEAWAESILVETGELDAMPRHLRPYFDFAAYGRDCQLNGDIWIMETNAGTAVFWNR